MVREVVIYPDARLRQVSRQIHTFDGTLHDLLDDMYETMIAREGVGLAAIQVGIDLRALIINLPDEDAPQLQPKSQTIEMINPVFEATEGSVKCQEGCLSVPGFYEEIERFRYVKVRYQDRFGAQHRIESDTFLAIAIQHEMDHLDGKVFVEKLSFTKRKKFEKEWRKRLKEM